MFLGNNGLVTQVNIKSSGNTVVSPLSTSIGWATTGGMRITSTGFPITGGSTSFDISTGGGWASTGGLKIASTGFPTSTSIDIASGNIVVSTGKIVLYTSTGLEGTRITDGTDTLDIDASGRITLTPLTTSSVVGSELTTGGSLMSTSGLKVTSTGISVSQSSSFTISALTTSTIIGVVPSYSATPTIYNVTLSLTDTEYSQAFLSSTRAFEFKCRTDVDIRYAFTSSIIATPSSSYMTLKAGTEYYKEDLSLTTTQYIYIATDSTAAPVTEITMWN